jgi:O-antigen/teichoic acid export membrane protein
VEISKRKTFHNILFNSLRRGATLTCQLLASAVVARDLTAADMGVVGFANIIVGFLTQFSDCGVGDASIRRPNLTRANLDTAFTLRLILGAGAFATALLVAPFSHYFCDHPAAANVTRLLALNFLVSTIGFLPLIQLTREMNYRALVVPGVISATVRAGLIITLVFSGWSFWAIVAADLAANLATGIALQVLQRTPPRLRFDLLDMKSLLRFGLPLLGTGLLPFLIFNFANFFVSAKLGIDQLGYYLIAVNWGSLICGLLGETVNSVLFPTFAAIQGDTDKMRRWYLKTIDLVAFVAVIANTALLANVVPFLQVFLGKNTDKWLPAALTLQIFCAYGIIRAITEPLGSCLLARGHTRVLLNSCIMVCIVQGILVTVALHLGRIEWVAIAVLIAYASQAFIYVPFLRREFGIATADLVKRFGPIIPAALAGYFATIAIFPTSAHSLFVLGFRLVFTAAVCAAVHGLVTGFRCFRETKDLLSMKLFAGGRAVG